MLDRLSLGHLEPLHDRSEPLAAEDAQQRILERKVESATSPDRPGVRRARGAGCRCGATRGARADDVQPPGGDHGVVPQLPFGTQAADLRVLLGRGQRLVLAQLEDLRLDRAA